MTDNTFLLFAGAVNLLLACGFFGAALASAWAYSGSLMAGPHEAAGYRWLGKQTSKRFFWAAAFLFSSIVALSFR